MRTPTHITVDAGVNPHSHIREAVERMRRKLSLILTGGIEIILPMPNTDAGLCTAEHVKSYIGFAKSLEADLLVTNNLGFIPCMMLTEQTTLDDLQACIEDGIRDVKVYPRFRTTKSEKGVVRYAAILPLIKKCGQLGIRVHVHPEHPSTIYGNRDAEYAFVPIVQMFLEETNTVIVWEHGTDARCIPFWKEFARAYTSRFYVTLTAHHLAANEDNTFGDVGATCKPPIKTEGDRLGLVALVAQGYEWVMAGADDAPHDISKKHVRGQCACGAYTAPYLMALYAHALSFLFDIDNGLEVFENLTSRNARKLYALPNASKQIVLERKSFTIPGVYEIDDWRVEPFWAHKSIEWSLAV